MNYTNEQLKQALAKMLPNILHWRTALDTTQGMYELCWTNTNNSDHPDDWFDVRDTELLHLCWMVEDTLTKRECQDYTQGMRWEETPNTPPYDYVWHATWQQRVIALAKVKGVDIV